MRVLLFTGREPSISDIEAPNVLTYAGNSAFTHAEILSQLAQHAGMYSAGARTFCTLLTTFMTMESPHKILASAEELQDNVRGAGVARIHQR